MTYDVAAVGAQFPALRAGTAHFDGPGGTQVPEAVARVAAAPRWPTCSAPTRAASSSAAAPPSSPSPRRLGLGDTGGLRVGLAPYSDRDDVDRLLAALRGFLAVR